MRLCSISSAGYGGGGGDYKRGTTMAGVAARRHTVACDTDGLSHPGGLVRRVAGDGEARRANVEQLDTLLRMASHATVP